MYRIEYSGNKHADYRTMYEARRVANEIHQHTGIIVGIEVAPHTAECSSYWHDATIGDLPCDCGHDATLREAYA